MTFDYDLFVIGGGSGGVRAARIAASEYGARVGLAEEDHMGGTCVIRGCVPKKLMIFASQAGAMAAESRGYGWAEASAGSFDWPAFHGKLARELDRLEGAYSGWLMGAWVRVHHQRPRTRDTRGGVCHHPAQWGDGHRGRRDRGDQTRPGCSRRAPPGGLPRVSDR